MMYPAIWCYVLIIWKLAVVAYGISVEISTPVNPVEVRAIFSVLCKVRELTSNHMVSLYRTTEEGGTTQVLTSKENVDQEIDERVFLAVRRIEGSEVYFLTITDFTRADVGNYSCKVIRNSPTVAEVASETIAAQLLYFPPASDPECSNSGDPITVVEGTNLELNCSSDLGNPPVSIAWSRAGHTYLKGASVFNYRDRIYSILTLRVRMGNDGDIFLCEIQSSVDPYKSTCHAGPIRVIPNSDASMPLLEYTTEVATIKPASSSTSKYPKNLSTACRNICASSSAHVPKRWIISTAIAGGFATILLLIIILVSIKYSSNVPSSSSNSTCNRKPYRTPDEIYTELQYRKSDLVYVPAEKSKHMLEQTRIEQDAFEVSPYSDS